VLALWCGHGHSRRPWRIVTLGRSQADLAAELGTTRESLNRALRGFADLDLLEMEGARVGLLDWVGLAAYAG